MSVVVDVSREYHDMMVALMRKVYGDFEGDMKKFPKPLGHEEAGPCVAGQRRYLWTDAFGVLNFVSMSEYALAHGMEEEGQLFVGAARKLVDTVFECLGSPRSQEFPMLMKPNGSFVGVRIGKRLARKQTDNGMEFDGMYFHYMDKFLFAISRLSLLTKDSTLLERGAQLAKEVAPHFIQFQEVESKLNPIGVYWKLNVDMSPPKGSRARPSSDAVSGYIVYSILSQTAERLGIIDRIDLTTEINWFRTVMDKFKTAGGLVPTSDILGFGLQLWESQWLEEPDWLASMKALVPRILIEPQLFGLPFRAFGGMIGAQCCEDPKLQSRATQMIQFTLQTQILNQQHDPSLDSINNVMFASCLNPSAFRKKPHESKI